MRNPRHALLMVSWLVTLLPLGGLLLGETPATAAEAYDVVVYGGTSAGVTAAVQAKRMGHSAVIVCPDKHLGGLSSGGLGFTDTGNKAVIGGLAREFYHKIWETYRHDDAWRWQNKADYGNKGQGAPAIDGERRTMWIFEPHVAENAFEAFVADHRIPVYRDEWLDRDSGVTQADGRITAIRMLSGRTIQGRMFVDATYEGDLLATAGVDYTVGRESREHYGEEWNGVQIGVLHHGHHFETVPQPISAYVVPGDPSSGVLPRISAEPPGKYGMADKRVQAYCFRMCLTNDPRNRVPFPKPEGYDPKQYEVLARVLDAGWREGFRKFDPIPNHKTDTNNHGPFSTDNIGYNYDYPEGSYERRQEIVAEHEVYQKGLMYFLANEPRVPQDVREKFAEWGLAADEFEDNGNWPHQLYIREARRMIGEFVMTENELLKKRPTPQSIGMGSYTMDSHNVQRYIKPNGDVENEGDIGVSTRGPYQIAFGSILPKRAQCENLLVPVCLSSSHIAFGSIRMEPVFMILGQSAATTAALALKNDIAVQDVDYDELRQQLLADGQVLEYTADELNKLGVDPTKIQGTVVDNAAAQLSGNWTPSTSGPSVGRNYLHDGNAGNGKATARFAAQLPSGRYQVRLAYSQNANRASNVPLLIEHAGGRHFIQINQRQQPPIDQLFISLGEFRFAEDSPAVVTLCNRGTNGYVIADAVQFLPLDSGVPDSASAPPVGSPRDALTAIEDQPGLPRVLLIGDSISMGYTLPVRRLLAGKANVHHPPENCGSSGRGLQRLDRWLGAKKWDVIVFNFGIHDAKLPPEGTGHATLDEYHNNLSKILQRLLETEATILWATSTPIPNGGQLAPNRRFANIDGYNHKALQVMEEYELRVIDLNAEIRPHLQSEQKPNDVHFTPAGSQRLARRVAQSILATLPAKQ